MSFDKIFDLTAGVYFHFLLFLKPQYHEQAECADNTQAQPGGGYTAVSREPTKYPGNLLRKLCKAESPLYSAVGGGLHFVGLKKNRLTSSST